MKSQDQHYKKYENMINSRSKYFAEKWYVEYEEVRGRALEIYCQCLWSHDSNKASFSTYLYNSLHNLNFYCKMLAYHKSATCIDEAPPESMAVHDIQDCILQQSIQTELSTIAQRIVHGVIDGTALCFEPYKKLFSINNITDKYNLDFYTAQNVIHEIKTWWNKFYSEI